MNQNFKAYSFLKQETSNTHFYWMVIHTIYTVLPISQQANPKGANENKEVLKADMPLN